MNKKKWAQIFLLHVSFLFFGKLFLFQLFSLYVGCVAETRKKQLMLREEGREYVCVCKKGLNCALSVVILGRTAHTHIRESYQ